MRHELNKARGAGLWGGRSYLPADPRLVEAHDDSTVVPPTGADCSAPQHLPGANLPHSQHLSNQEGGTSKGEGAGRQRQGQGSEVIDSDTEGKGGVQQGKNDYLLADPRLAGAPDDGTVELLTGTARSAHKALLDSDWPHSHYRSGECKGGRKRAASNTGSSTSSSRSGTSVKATLQKRRRQNGWQDDTLQAETQGTEYGIGDDFHQAETKGIGDKNHNHLQPKNKAENKAET